MDAFFLALVAVSVILLLLSVAFFTAAYFLRRASTKEDDLESGAAHVADIDIMKIAAVVGSDGVKKYKWREIEALTENFSTTVIGQGGFSTVYLGKLQSGSVSSVVAVKVHRESERLHHAFKRELEVLLKLRHNDNIVKLIGYCDEPEDDGALVFEYVPNGTLHDKLHGGKGEVVLTWSERMGIAHDLAKAVAHLHESCDLQIIHSDLKPANVLLDSDHRAKLCDFGSATMGFSSAVVRGRHAIVGSPGYSDPHYLRTGTTSKKSDVYSFGVVLLELVTGKEAFQPERGSMLTKEMAEVLSEAEGRAGEMGDGRLGGRFVAEEAVAMAEVVRGCVGEQPSLRPSMAELVRLLEEKVGRRHRHQKL